jgi:diadenosine tetraphosphate (Ap4A) HIT family hydrolase
MSIVGDALLEVTGAYRINYVIMGNSDQVLHAHIVPRYLTEPDEFRRNTPWSYPQDVMGNTLFDSNRDRELMSKINDAIRKRL